MLLTSLKHIVTSRGVHRSREHTLVGRVALVRLMDALAHGLNLGLVEVAS